MSDIIPSNKKKTGLLDIDFDDFSTSLSDFFNERWPLHRKMEEDTFKLDVQETDTQYVIDAELPGVQKEEVKVELDKGRLTIEVEREEKVDKEEKNYIHQERRYSSMSRSIYLKDTKSDGVKAKLENGVLNLVIQKEEKPQTSVKVDIE